MEQSTRKTRFVCVSDTHNAINGGAFKLPKGDVLIHAGDLSNQGTFSELSKALQWIEAADFEQKIVIAGNHDITLDSPFYDQYGLYHHNQNPQDTFKCQELFEKSQSITYLKHEAAVIRLTALDGPRTIFKVFGSPYSPAKGQWAFGYQPEEAERLWDKVPLDVDITVTHTPPKYHCDETDERRAVGCESLRRMLWRVRPRLAICGHVHAGRGAEIVKWDLGMANIKYKEIGVDRWKDPGEDNKKTSLFDLTAKGKMKLANDGSVARDLIGKDEAGPADSMGRVGRKTTYALQYSQSVLSRTVPNNPNELGVDRLVQENIEHFPSEPTSENYRTLDNDGAAGYNLTPQNSRKGITFLGADTNFIPSTMSKKGSIYNGLSQAATSLLAVPKISLVLTTRGQGGIPPSHRCDLEALSGRLGRKETCVVNAAIMASSWPYRGNGGRKYHKPIVIDIDLSCWDE